MIADIPRREVATLRTNAANSLRYRHEFQNVAIEILEVNATTAVPIVELFVIERPRSTPEYDPSGFHAMQDHVEFCVADVERIMVALKCFVAVTKEQCQTCVDAHRCEVAVLTIEAEPK
jgi:hypothetical protein